MADREEHFYNVSTCNAYDNCLPLAWLQPHVANSR